MFENDTNQAQILIPDGKLAVSNEDAAAKKRKELARKLKEGQKVAVDPNGTLLDPNDPKAGAEDGKTLKVPDGKLASFYWYDREPGMLEAEKRLMRETFPQFRLEKLDDGRLCWIGTLKPCGDDGLHWTLQAVYDNNHPHRSTHGGSLKIYSIDPDLDDLQREVIRNINRRGLPHVLSDGAGHIYMCTARVEDVQAGRGETSASKALRWAIKWTFAVTCWLNGEIGDEIYDHTF